MERALVTRLFPRAGKRRLGTLTNGLLLPPFRSGIPVLGRFGKMLPVSRRRYSSKLALDERWIVPPESGGPGHEHSDSCGREYSTMSSATNAYGDGKAAKRIVNALLERAQRERNYPAA